MECIVYCVHMEVNNQPLFPYTGSSMCFKIVSVCGDVNPLSASWSKLLLFIGFSVDSCHYWSLQGHTGLTHYF